MFSRILVPIDLEEPAFSDGALRLAMKDVHDSAAELHLLTIVPGCNTPLVTSYFHQAAIKKATSNAIVELKRFADSRIPDSVPVSLSVQDGAPAEQILKKARDMEADLIIMAAHNRGGIDGDEMGSTSSKVVAKARCSVVVLRADSADSCFDYRATEQALNMGVS
ncbi:universal stress protein [Motiliproteus sp. MSK22-1]|uniref:universal stress protein n=1 Tax=Motiliproteus sp. MSK22-1 TaxID=1897630 RepID=UPI000975CE2A|nr:universal stress protein [Motiliproteus sp. MSK22-1]OMH25602.1 hypothetical protein BGP75_23935 [Motiliproteus sp. MSK22-1]